MQSIPTLIGGIYTIRVSGSNHTTGAFSLQAVLNASLEEEGRKKRAYNDSSASAQSIDTSYVRFSTDLESFSRGSLVGSLGRVSDGIPDATILYSADFETGNDGFSDVNDNGRNSLWNRTERRGNETGHSATHSFWYGNPATGTYDTGGGGSMVSPAINLPNTAGGLSFDFNYYLQSDTNTTFDVRVGVSNDGGATFGLFDPPLPSLAQTSGGWSASTLYDLSSYKGKLIRLFFGFHTGAGFDTTREGVFIDDIKVYKNALPKDYYSLTASAGEKFSIYVVELSGNANPSLVKVELIGVDRTTVLATGIGGASNIGGAINGFAAPTNGTYFVRLTSPVLDAGAGGDVNYTLLVTKDALFDLEPNGSAVAAQSTAGTKAALGYAESLTSVDSGWYDSTGAHNAANPNYVVGQLQSFGGLQTLHDWFVFDVPSIPGLITNASIELFNPSGGYASPDATETLTIFDVITPIAKLRAGGSGLTEIYEDLGSGTTYGSVTVSSNNNNSIVVINLTAAGLAAINAAKGSQIAFGGAITSLAGNTEQYLFAFSQNSSPTRRLILNGERSSSDWYSVTLASDQTAIQVETRTPGDGPGEIRNALNPRIELYNADGTTLIASGVALSDGRNEKILVSGLTPNATYKVRVLGEANTVGEYYMTATPLRVPKVELPVLVGDGTAQRSNVKQLQVTFDGIVNIANLNSGAFTVRQRGDSGGVVVSQATATVVNNRTLVTLNFSGLFTEASGSLKDGNYDLTIDATQITRNGLRLDGDSDGSAGGDYHFGADSNGNLKATDNFFRFFGDADGDRDVDALDLSLFNLAFRKPPNAYTAIFDFDADNDVDGLDLSQFSRRFRKSLR